MKFLLGWYRKLFTEDTPLQGYAAHIPHGAFTVFAATHVHWTIALLFGTGFIIFEIYQEADVGDKAHDDIAGWLLGMAIYGLFFAIFL